MYYKNMYYKAIKTNLTFNEAIDYFKRGNIIRLKDKIADPNNVNIDDMRFTVNQIMSNDWEVVVIDRNKNDMLDEIRDIMHDINLDIDTRFYDESRMNIFDYWSLFDNQFINEDLAYNIIKYVYENKNKLLKNNKK